MRGAPKADPQVVQATTNDENLVPYILLPVPHRTREQGQSFDAGDGMFDHATDRACPGIILLLQLSERMIAPGFEWLYQVGSFRAVALVAFVLAEP